MLARFGNFTSLEKLTVFLKCRLSPGLYRQINECLTHIEDALKKNAVHDVKKNLHEFNHFLNIYAQSNLVDEDKVVPKLLQYYRIVLRYVSDQIYQSRMDDLVPEDNAIAQEVEETRKRAYQNACHFDLTIFAPRDNHQLSNFGSFDLNLLITFLQCDFREDIHIVDLGTKNGGLVSSINQEQQNKTPKIVMWGIEAENEELKLDDPHIMKGDMCSDLPKLIATLPKKPHAFISQFAFNILFDPIKTLCDAYSQVERNGYVCINHIVLPGLNVKEGNNLFEYLKIAGYEIHAQEDKKVLHIWQGLVLIKKNYHNSLDIPLHYAGVLNSLMIINEKPTSILLAQYKPNINLLEFQRKSVGISSKEFNAILNSYQTTSSFWKKQDHGSDITNLRKCSAQEWLITETDVHNALSPDRQKLFQGEREANKTSTDHVILRLINALIEAREISKFGKTIWSTLEEKDQENTDRLGLRDKLLGYQDKIYDDHWKTYNAGLIEGQNARLQKNLNDKTHVAYRSYSDAFFTEKNLTQYLHMQSKRMLQLGCATGRFIEMFQLQGWDVKGYDYAPSAITYLEQKNIPCTQADLNAVNPIFNRLMYEKSLADDLLHGPNNILLIRILEYLKTDPLTLLLLLLIDNAAPGSVYFAGINAFRQDTEKFPARIPNYVASFFAPRTDMEFLVGEEIFADDGLWVIRKRITQEQEETPHGEFKKMP